MKTFITRAIDLAILALLIVAALYVTERIKPKPVPVLSEEPYCVNSLIEAGFKHKEIVVINRTCFVEYGEQKL